MVNRISTLSRRAFTKAAGMGVAGATLTVPLLGRPVAADDPSAVGQWSPVYPWPNVAIHLHLLPKSTDLNARLLTYADDDVPGLKSRNAGFSKTFVIDIPAGSDPATTWTYVPNNVTNLFCSGHTFLPDGTLLVTGGHIDDNYYGSADINIFDYGPPYAWKTLPNSMNAGRWYGSMITLPNGEALVLSGNIAGSTTGNPLPQVWRTNDGGGLRDLSTAQLKMANYPKLFIAPDGRVVTVGPEQLTRYLDTAGTGHWSSGPKRLYGKRNQGTAVMYDDGKVLYVGGATANNVAPTNTAEILDLNATAPAWRWTNPMRFARKHGTATILPDGKVLVTGGSNATAYNDAAGAILAPELWDPGTTQWTTMASAQTPRIYHSTALLLPDARVLSAGGGRPKAQNGGQNNLNVEIFSPPYIFKGNRPVIAAAPASVAYGETFPVQMANSTGIAQAVFMGLGSVTHTVNMTQRRKVLSVSQSGATLQVTVPTNRNQLPPCHYMLFALNGQGVPSVAKIIRVG
jgi:galactose oxidase